MPERPGKAEWPRMELVRRGGVDPFHRGTSLPRTPKAGENDLTGFEVEDYVPVPHLEELRDALGEAIDVAEEGWSYASDYFREKWECEREIGKLRTALKKADEVLGGTDA